MLSACNISSRVLCRSWNYTSRRWKSKKEHWAKKRNKITSSMKALQHFDDFYKKVYGKHWPSIRVSLLSPNKYCAVVNSFGDAPETISYFQNQGASDLRHLMNMNKQQTISEDVENYQEKPCNRLDYKIEQLISDTQAKEFSETYPAEKERVFLQESIDNKIDVSPPLTSSGHNESLEASLKKAEIDVDRIIDPSVGLSASALFEFVPATKLKGLDKDYVLESDHYRYYSGDTEFPVSTKIETSFDYPEFLNVFTYERGNVTSFESPQKGSTGVLNYYLMDGGSVLPVLALGIKYGDNVLDMCAAPGGKSLLMLQTLLPARLVCNDVKESRVNRIHSVMNQYIYDLPKWKGRLVVTQDNGCTMEEEGKYDKILVDVPCTNDRHSLHEDDNNIFSVTRMKERLRLPELQAQLLKNALKLLVPGGAAVYSTCSLSPIQNDGVVHMALRHIWEETNIGVEVRDLSPALEAAKDIFHLGNNVGLRYGHLVLPFLPANFGPMYFCKLVRTK